MTNAIRTLFFATIGFFFPIVTIVFLGLLFPGSEQFQRHAEDEANFQLLTILYGGGVPFSMLWAYAGYQLKLSCKRCLHSVLGIYVGTFVGLFLVALGYRVWGTPASQTTVSVISLSVWFLSSFSFSYLFIRNFKTEPNV